MDTDWLFQGIIDAEQKEYILLNYFQKLNQNLEDMKMYPMFIELSLHLGNIQTLLTKNQILYTDKKFKSPDDELIISDLKVKQIPEMTQEEFEEYRKILKYSQPKLFDYFNIAKSIWSVVYDSINVTVKKNRKNIKNKSGFFYYRNENQIYVWKYTTTKVPKTKNLTKTKIEEIYIGEIGSLTIQKILSTFSKNYQKKEESKYPIFEVTCSNIFPIEETLLPIFKRKILTVIAQSTNSRINTVSKIYDNGIQ